MSAALVADIITAWQADATLADVAGPWIGEAADKEAYPYAVIKFVGDGADAYHFDRTLLENPHLRITIFDADLQDLLSYHRAMDDLLLQHELGGSGASTTDAFVRCQKLGGSRIVDALAKPATSGATVYFASSAYSFTTQRTLP